MDSILKNNNNEIIFENYKSWLTSTNNPNFNPDKDTDTPQFRSYPTALKKNRFYV